MLTTLFVSFAIASVLTAIYAFRFSASHQPARLTAYFLLFLTAEWVGERLLLPPGTLGPEVGFVALFITGLFVAASVIRDRLDPG